MNHSFFLRLFYNQLPIHLLQSRSFLRKNLDCRLITAGAKGIKINKRMAILIHISL